MDLERFDKFFTERPALKDTVLEREAGVPPGLIRKLRLGKRSLTDTYIKRFLPVLRKYGYKFLKNRQR